MSTELSTSPTTQQLVAAAVDGDDVAGVVGLGLELGPQLGDVVVDGAGDRQLVIAPDVAQQLLAADHFVAMRDQIAQQLELAGRQRARAGPCAAPGAAAGGR